MTVFSAGNSLGARSPGQIGDYLVSIGDVDAAKPFLAQAATGQAGIPLDRAFTRTDSLLGFIPASTTPAKERDILGLGGFQAEQSLVGKRIKITLDKFYVHNYPGLGEHRILCEFSGKNQVHTEEEGLRFALKLRAKDGSGAGFSGAPIFLGLTVGADGVCFEGRTVNISSSIDEGLLQVLGTPAFQNGLSLITTAQPALKPFTGLAAAVVEHSASQSKCCQVHHFNLGLDFSNNATSARLALGSYVVAQTNPHPNWKWADLTWNQEQQLVQFRDPKKTIDFNYIVIGVSQFLG